MVPGTVRARSGSEAPVFRPGPAAIIEGWNPGRDRNAREMFADDADKDGRDRYELLRRLRRSERRIRAIRRRWRAFREDPDPATLARVRRELDRATAEVDRLARALRAPMDRASTCAGASSYRVL